jgi:hypothetical protein
MSVWKASRKSFSLIVDIFLIIAVILEELIQFIDIFNASKVSRGPLMDFGGLDSKNSSSSRRSCTTRLFHDHRHWCTFIEEPQLSIWRTSSGWITVNPTIDKNIMYISDKGSDIASIRSVTAKERNISEAFGAADDTSRDIVSSYLIPTELDPSFNAVRYRFTGSSKSR